MKMILHDIKKYVLMDNANDFIDYWNDTIDHYERITRADVGDYFGNFSNNLCDSKFGWDRKISAKKNLKVKYRGDHAYWKLNLPKEKRLNN